MPPSLTACLLSYCSSQSHPSTASPVPPVPSIEMTTIILFMQYDQCHQGDKGMCCVVYPKLHRFPLGKPVSAYSFQLGHQTTSLNTQTRLQLSSVDMWRPPPLTTPSHLCSLYINHRGAPEVDHTTLQLPVYKHRMTYRHIHFQNRLQFGRKILYIYNNNNKLPEIFVEHREL